MTDLTMTRRQALRAAAVLGASALGSGESLNARAEDAPLAHVEMVNPSGLDTKIIENLLSEGGFLKSFGLTANFMDVADGTKILAALVSGSGDLCSGSGISGLFPAIAQGAKLKIIAGSAVKPTTAIYTKRSDIKEAKDLVGRTVGVGAPGALLHSLLVALLKKKGIDYTQVKFVNIGSSTDVFRAVVAGTVDVGPSESGYFDQQEKYGVHALTDGALWDQLPEFTNKGIYATDEAITKKRDILVRTLAAHAKLFRFMSKPESKEAFFRARAEAFGKDEPADALSHWKFYQTAQPLSTDLLISEASMGYMQDLNIELGVQKTRLPFAQVADMSLAKDALKLLSA